MTDDIVATLRLWAKNANEQGVTNAVDGLQAAADEIERLRQLSGDAGKLREERDEARRRICEMSIRLGGVYRRIGGKTVEVTTPEGCAEMMRWDCFKEAKHD